jgi:uncharacterized membrane protein
MVHDKGSDTRRIPPIETISDGVFGVAMTLLILDIKVPVSELIHSETDLMGAFYALLPKFFTYFLSFMTLGLAWTGISTQFTYFQRKDLKLTWIILFFLLFVTVIPFSTTFLSDYISYKFAIGVYWLNIFLLGVLRFISWNYAYRHNLLDIVEKDKKEAKKAMNKRIIIAQSLYGIAALLCFISPYVSIGATILIQLNYVLAIFVKRSQNTPRWL